MNFFSISTSSIDFLLASIGSLFTSVMPIFLIVIGLAIGLWILDFIIQTMKTPRAKESGYYHEFKDNKPTWRGRFYEKGEEFDIPDDED
jgi:hypothetical protein